MLDVTPEQQSIIEECMHDFKDYISSLMNGSHVRPVGENFANWKKARYLAWKTFEEKKDYDSFYALMALTNGFTTYTPATILKNAYNMQNRKKKNYASGDYEEGCKIILKELKSIIDEVDKGRINNKIESMLKGDKHIRQFGSAYLTEILNSAEPERFALVNDRERRIFRTLFKFDVPVVIDYSEYIAVMDFLRDQLNKYFSSSWKLDYFDVDYFVWFCDSQRIVYDNWQEVKDNTVKIQGMSPGGEPYKEFLKTEKKLRLILKRDNEIIIDDFFTIKSRGSVSLTQNQYDLIKDSKRLILLYSNHAPSEVGDMRVFFFKYAVDNWGDIDKIKSIFDKKGYDSQEGTLTSYGVEPKNGDIFICLCKDTNEIQFMCRIRSPSVKNKKYDYVKPLFLNSPVNFETQVSPRQSYQLFRPGDKSENTRAVLFDLSSFQKELEQIKNALIENNPVQKEEILSYFPDQNMKQIPGLKGIPTLKFAKNVILYGPPGTGKTFKTKEFALSIISEYGNWEEKI